MKGVEEDVCESSSAGESGGIEGNMAERLRKD
jgi:hypothetical protein